MTPRRQNAKWQGLRFECFHGHYQTMIPWLKMQQSDPKSIGSLYHLTCLGQMSTSELKFWQNIKTSYSCNKHQIKKTSLIKKNSSNVHAITLSGALINSGLTSQHIDSEEPIDYGTWRTQPNQCGKSIKAYKS